MIKKLFILIVAILSFSNLKAQYNDAELWTSVGIDKTISSDWNFNIALGYRINNNFQSFSKAFIETGIEYKLNKYIKFAVGYRYEKKNNLIEEYIEGRNRFVGIVKTNYKISNIKFYWSLKYQQKYFDIYEPQWGNIKTTNYIRNKFQLKYKKKKCNISPFLSYEIFTPLFSTNVYQYNIDEHRFSAGLEYKFNKQNHLKLFFMYKKKLGDKINTNHYINGISYQFSF